MPAAAIMGPPMPTRFTVGSSARRARHKIPPWRSPEASPAESMMVRRSATAVAAREIAAHDRDAGPLGDAHGCLPIDDDNLARLHRESCGAPRRHRLESGGTDGRDVESKIMALRYRLDHDGTGAAEARPPPDRLVGTLGGLDGQGHPARSNDALADSVGREMPGQGEAGLNLAPLGRCRRARRHGSPPCHPRIEKGARIEDLDADPVEGGQDHGGQRLVRQAGSSDIATEIVRRSHPAEHFLLPQLADKDDRADLGVAERAHHSLKVGERARDDPLGVRLESGRRVESEGDDMPALAGGFRGGTAGEDPGPRHHREAALHGRSFGQAISPRPSRIILSISSATARDRRSSVSGSSTWPVARAARAAEIRWRISSLRGLSLWTNRRSTNEAWR